ncbi:hypothetical protein AHF37_02923 [Paragonimus kellicotti]|nr:hypothetical protein AHF37_02923 [Paragonimus kellicotti]
MHYREVMLSDKRGGGTNRKAIQASRRLELSVAAYREFLTCLGRMIKTTEADHIPDLSTSETQDIVEERLRIQSTAAESIMVLGTKHHQAYVAEIHQAEDAERYDPDRAYASILRSTAMRRSSTRFCYEIRGMSPQTV